MKAGPVLVTGATGYVGGRLVPLLLAEGVRVRAMGRSVEKLAGRSWARHPLVELAGGDVLDPGSLKQAASGCWAAYYLVHSMNPFTKDFARTDRQAARNMAAAAADAAMERIIYLGGIVPTDGPLSPHLASRAEVGRILAQGPVPTTILRAAMILGSGSASFEIMRYLMERMPIVLTPRQVKNLVQPICVRNVLRYLAGCLEHPETAGQTYDICGPDILSYRDLFRMYAREAGLGRRWILPLPFLTPRAISYLIHLVTPVHGALARPLTEGLRHTVICTDQRIKDILPQDLMDCRRTFRRIMIKEQQQVIETSWADAGMSLPYEWVQAGDADYAGGTVISRGYVLTLAAGPEKAWAPLVRIGGRTGWYYADFLWRLRGWADKVVGGVGSKRGRRHHLELASGDVLDFWRVIEIRPARRLVLMSEMKTPGQMVLSVSLSPVPDDQTRVEMKVRFLPKGLWGLVYWYALLPFHTWLYKGVLKALAGQVQTKITSGPRALKMAPQQKISR